MSIIYVDKSPFIDIVRLNERMLDEVDNSEYDVITRSHDFTWRICIAIKFQGRVFVRPCNENPVDPYEVYPKEEAVKAFDNLDWERLQELTM